MSGAPIGVLVMAYGGPGSLEEIPGYLADIRHGRPTPRAVLEEITENYRAIGGSSPLLAVSRRQADALGAELGPEFRCYLGMRHWSPWIEDVVGEMAEDGVTQAVSLVLAPHFSAMSVARYQQKIADGLTNARIGEELFARGREILGVRGHAADGTRRLFDRGGRAVGRLRKHLGVFLYGVDGGRDLAQRGARILDAAQQGLRKVAQTLLRFGHPGGHRARLFDRGRDRLSRHADLLTQGRALVAGGREAQRGRFDGGNFGRRGAQ